MNKQTLELNAFIKKLKPTEINDLLKNSDISNNTQVKTALETQNATKTAKKK